MNNRQSGRRRGRNNNGSNNGQRPQGGGRGDQANRIDSRARGNAAQLLEKYRNMARDAQLSGDRVMTEYYLQFADHYFRVLSDARNRQEEQRARFDGDGDEGGAPQNQSDDEAEDIDELDAIDMIGRAPRNRGNGNANGGNGNGNRDYNGNREDRPREERQRDDRPRDERARDERPRDDRPREGGQRDGNRDYNRDRPRDDRPRDERGRDDRPRDDRPREERPREDRPVRSDHRDARPPRNSDGDAPRTDAPRSDNPRSEGSEERVRRPRRERPERAERNNDHDDAPIGIDIAVLPPAIGLDTTRDEAPVAPAAANDDAAPAPKKRGRPRKVVSEGEDAAA